MELTARTIWRVLDGETGLESIELETLLVQLRASNAAQWNAEDVARQEASPEAIGTRKREIDRLNLQRVSLIHQIDHLFLRLLTPTPSAPPVTETPGALCDRLSILHLRLHHARRRLTSEDHYLIDELFEEAEYLREAFDVMLSDVAGGQRRFEVFAPKKLYGGTGVA